MIDVSEASMGFLNIFNGVEIFFTLSGFLIWWSIGRSRTYGEFLKKRFWRLYPELWLAVLVEILVILVLYQPIDWPKMGLFAITQSTFFQFWTPDFLRGYGCGTPNGALWTISVLIQFYLIAYFIYKALHGRMLWVWCVAIGVSFGISFLTPGIGSHVPEAMIGKIYRQTVIPYLWMFLSASLVAEKKDVVIPFLKKYWWAFVGAQVLNQFLLHWDVSASYPILGTLLIFLGLVGFAYSFPKLNVKTDISYGMYIYHMTVVNALITFGMMHDPWLFALVLAVTCFLAWISTMTVGVWAMRMKRKK